MTQMERELVFVTVGTDHHPFDRLCGWADAWVAGARHPEVPWFVQSGTSQAPEAAPYRLVRHCAESVIALPLE